MGGLGAPDLPPALRVVVFDVDGTLAETERDGHRIAFNRSFERRGLPDRWDDALYAELVRVAGSRERLRHYFDRHRPLPVAARDRLVAELHRMKNEEFRRLVDEIDFHPRPGVLRLLDELHRDGLMTAVATSGSPECIVPLLGKLLGPGRLSRFSLIVTGEDVTRKKPDPEIYRLALVTLGLAPEEALAVEDSRNGLDAARGAGVPCLVVPSSYSRDHDFQRANLVVEELGDPSLSSRVLHNPHRIRVTRMVDIATLRRLHRAAQAGALADQPRGRCDREAKPCRP